MMSSRPLFTLALVLLVLLPLIVNAGGCRSWNYLIVVVIAEGDRMRNQYIVEGDGRRNAFLKPPKPNIPFMA